MASFGGFVYKTPFISYKCPVTPALREADIVMVRGQAGGGPGDILHTGGLALLRSMRKFTLENVYNDALCENPSFPVKF